MGGLKCSALSRKKKRKKKKNVVQGIQCFVSAEYLFGRPKSPEKSRFNCSEKWNFLWRNITSNVRNKGGGVRGGQLIASVSGGTSMSFKVPNKIN